jgi:predicted O-linked N-acetylglucosamine transferase (SPINDLY family)
MDYSERLVRLPSTFVCYSPAMNERAAPGVPPSEASGEVTFGSFHRLAKLNDAVLESWAAILQRVPRSRMLLVAGALHEADARTRIADAFARRGVAADRLELIESRSFRDYLRLHHRVDLLLDSFPWTGHTVACHAAWMGVPTVTLAGDTHRSRMVASLFMNLQLPELITGAREQYVTTAVTLVTDVPRLRKIRRSLRDRLAASPLLDHAGFARDVEAAYRHVWRTWCESSNRQDATAR